MKKMKACPVCKKEQKHGLNAADRIKDKLKAGAKKFAEDARLLNNIEIDQTKKLGKYWKTRCRFVEGLLKEIVSSNKFDFKKLPKSLMKGDRYGILNNLSRHKSKSHSPTPIEKDEKRRHHRPKTHSHTPLPPPIEPHVSVMDSFKNTPACFTLNQMHHKHDTGKVRTLDRDSLLNKICGMGEPPKLSNLRDRFNY